MRPIEEAAHRRCDRLDCTSRQPARWMIILIVPPVFDKDKEDTRRPVRVIFGLAVCDSCRDRVTPEQFLGRGSKRFRHAVEARFASRGSVSADFENARIEFEGLA